MNGVKYNTSIVVNGVDNTAAAFGSIGAGVDRLNGKIVSMQRGLQRAGTTATQAGSAMMIGFTAPISMAAKGVVDTMRVYEKASAELAATMAVDVSKIAAFQKQAETLAGQTIFSEAQIVSAQREAAMAGFSTEEVLGAVPGVLDLATMSGMEIPQASMMVTDVLRGLGKDVEFLPGLLDQVAYASTKANQDTEKFLRGLTRFGPIARQMRIPLEESLGYLSELADAGFKAAEGGNALRTIMLRMSAPTKHAREAIASLGIDLSQFREGGADAGGVISALVQSGVAGAAELERLKPRIQQALTIEPPEGMTREQSLINMLTGELNLSGMDGSALSDALGEYLSRSVAGLDVKGFLKEVNEQIEAQGLDPLPFVNSLFGKQRAAQGATLLAGIESIEKRSALIASQSAASAARMNETMMQSIDSRLKLVTSAKEVFQRAVWDAGFGGVFENFTQGITNTFLAAAKLPKPLLEGATKVAAFAAAAGVGTLALGGFLRIAAFSLVPFAAMGKAMAAVTARTVALGASLVSLRAIKALVSPVGLLAVGMAGLGASMLGVLKGSPLVGKTVSALGQNVRELWAGFAEGDGDKVGNASRNLGRNLRILRFETKQVIGAWMEATPEGRRLKGILTSLSEIGTNISNAFGNVRAAVSGFFVGISNALGLTDDLGNAFGNLSENSQGLVGWLLRALAGVTRVGDQSESLSSIFTDLGEKVGWLINTAVAPFKAAFESLADVFDKAFNSSAFAKFEGLLGIESGGTVSAINNITGAVKSLAQSLFALGIASLAIFGVKRTLKGLGAMGGLLGLGGKGKGTSGGTVVGGAGAGAGKTGSNNAKKGFLAGVSKWLPALNAGMLGLGAYGSDQSEKERRRELEAQGQSPEQAVATVLSERHERFAESALGRFLQLIGEPLEHMGRAANDKIGLKEGDSPRDALWRIWSPHHQLDDEAAAKRKQAYMLQTHDITQLPMVRDALARNALGGEGQSPKVAGLTIPFPSEHLPTQPTQAAQSAGGAFAGYVPSEQAKAPLLGQAVAESGDSAAVGGEHGGHDGEHTAKQPASLFTDFRPDMLPTTGQIETPKPDLDGTLSALGGKVVVALKQLNELLASGAVKAEMLGRADVNVNVMAGDGLRATAVATSAGPISLNTGRSRLAP